MRQRGGVAGVATPAEGAAPAKKTAILRFFWLERGYSFLTEGEAFPFESIFRTGCFSKAILERSV